MKRCGAILYKKADYNKKEITLQQITQPRQKTTHKQHSNLKKSMDRVLSKIRGVSCRVKNHEVAVLSAYTRFNDLPSLIDKLNEMHVENPGIWTDRDGKQVLRRLATAAALLGFRDIAMFLVKTMNVAPHSFPDKDTIYKTDKHETDDSFCSPLIGALEHEDLALELLALVPRGDDCLSETTTQNSDLLMLAMEKGAARVAHELLIKHKVVIDHHSYNSGHSALCIAAQKGDSHLMSIILGEYMARGRLQEALLRPCDINQECDNSECASYPLMYHVRTVEMAHLLMTWWQAEIPKCKNVGFERPVHRAAFHCNLPLLEFYVGRCGLGADDPGKDSCVTPLRYACKNPDSTDAQLLPVVKYLLQKGASTRAVGCKCRPPWKLALENGKAEVHDFILETHRNHQKPESIIGQPGEGGFDVDEVAGTGGRRKTKKTGKKKRKPRWRKTEPVGEEIGPETEESHKRRIYEQAMREMREIYKKEIEEVFSGAEENLGEEIAAGLGGLSLDLTDDDDDDVPDLVDDFEDEVVEDLVEDLGDEIVDEIVEDVVEAPVEKVVPSEYVCPISFHIMTSPVIAMDGHSYEETAIQEWIATCNRKNLPVTSPFTNMPMASNLIPNLTLRNLIRSFGDDVDV